MRLEDVLPALRDGKKIYRVSKDRRYDYVQDFHNRIEDYEMNGFDLLAEDWEVENES